MELRGCGVPSFPPSFNFGVASLPWSHCSGSVKVLVFSCSCYLAVVLFPFLVVGVGPAVTVDRRGVGILGVCWILFLSDKAEQLGLF